MNAGVKVEGVWVRKIQHEDRQCVEVLVELEGRWRRVYCEPAANFITGEVSHIIEPGGIIDAPLDPFTEVASAASG